MLLTRIIAVSALLFIFAVMIGVLLEKIERVEVTGYHPHVDIKTLRDQLKTIHQKNWWLLDEEALSDKLIELAWLREVVVEKKWPNSVLITLQEHQPILRWKGTLIAKTGQWFTPNHKDLHEWKYLPQVESSTRALTLLLPLLEYAKKAFDSNKITLELFKVTPWNTIEITLKSGTQIVLDDVDFTKKINEIILFIKLNPEYDEEAIKHIDLRYNNGFTLRNIKRG